MRISDWSSDVCSSDLYGGRIEAERGVLGIRLHDHLLARRKAAAVARPARCRQSYRVQQSLGRGLGEGQVVGGEAAAGVGQAEVIERGRQRGRASCREGVCKYG